MGFPCSRCNRNEKHSMLCILRQNVILYQCVIPVQIIIQNMHQFALGTQIVIKFRQSVLILYDAIYNIL